MKKLSILLFTILISLSVSGQSINKISRDWTPFSQFIKIETDSVKKFKVIAFAKVDTDDNKAWAGIWARVDNKPDQGRGFFDNMGNRPIVINEWKSYIIEGTVDSKSDKLSFGAICSNNGKFYFDKFELYLEDDNGEYQLVEINNPSFENSVADNTIPGWSQGISKGDPYTVKEFTFSTSSDSLDGSYSLLVEGAGITNKTGGIEAELPYLGIVIALMFLLILVFSLATHAFPTTENKWSNLGKIGFRFSFIYFLLFILFQNNEAYPFWDRYVMKTPTEWLHEFIPWVGKNILHLPYDITTFSNGSGDTTYDYVMVVVMFIIAVFGTVIWSVIDRKRSNYKKLYYWLSVAVRYYVGLMLIDYGLSKVIQLQFPDPSFHRLTQPFGEASPMGLAWTFLGFSKGYNMFMGIAEILAGLLLFRRTLTFGAVITLMTAMNVMAVNYFYDVPVKVISTHLVIMTLFLLSRDIKQVISYLMTNKPVEKLSLIIRPKLKKGLNISLNVLKGLVLFYALGYGFYKSLDDRKLYGSKAPKPELYGIYEVTNFVVNGDTITNYKSDKLWKNIAFEHHEYVEVLKMNEQRVYFRAKPDSTGQKIKFFTSIRGSEYFDFFYTKTNNTLDFRCIFENDTISGQTKRLDKEDFRLTGRGFNWINEYPHNY